MTFCCGGIQRLYNPIARVSVQLLRGISTQLATLNSSRALAPVRLGLATNLLACPYVSKAMALGVIKGESVGSVRIYIRVSHRYIEIAVGGPAL